MCTCNICMNVPTYVHIFYITIHTCCDLTSQHSELGLGSSRTPLERGDQVAVRHVADVLPIHFQQEISDLPAGGGGSTWKEGTSAKLLHY